MAEFRTLPNEEESPPTPESVPQTVFVRSEGHILEDSHSRKETELIPLCDPPASHASLKCSISNQSARMSDDDDRQCSLEPITKHRNKNNHKQANESSSNASKSEILFTGKVLSYTTVVCFLITLTLNQTVFRSLSAFSYYFAQDFRIDYTKFSLVVVMNFPGNLLNLGLVPYYSSFRVLYVLFSIEVLMVLMNATIVVWHDLYSLMLLRLVCGFGVAAAQTQINGAIGAFTEGSRTTRSISITNMAFGVSTFMFSAVGPVLDALGSTRYFIFSSCVLCFAAGIVWTVTPAWYLSEGHTVKGAKSHFGHGSNKHRNDGSNQSGITDGINDNHGHSLNSEEQRRMVEEENDSRSERGSAAAAGSGRLGSLNTTLHRMDSILEGGMEEHLDRDANPYEVSAMADDEFTVADYSQSTQNRRDSVDHSLLLFSTDPLTPQPSRGEVIFTPSMIGDPVSPLISPNRRAGSVSAIPEISILSPKLESGTMADPSNARIPPTSIGSVTSFSAASHIAVIKRNPQSLTAKLNLQNPVHSDSRFLSKREETASVESVADEDDPGYNREEDEISPPPLISSAMDGHPPGSPPSFAEAIRTEIQKHDALHRDLSFITRRVHERQARRRLRAGIGSRYGQREMLNSRRPRFDKKGLSLQPKKDSRQGYGLMRRVQSAPDSISDAAKSIEHEMRQQHSYHYNGDEKQLSQSKKKFKKARMPRVETSRVSLSVRSQKHAIRTLRQKQYQRRRKREAMRNFSERGWFRDGSEIEMDDVIVGVGMGVSLEMDLDPLTESRHAFIESVKSTKEARAQLALREKQAEERKIYMWDVLLLTDFQLILLSMICYKMALNAFNFTLSEWMSQSYGLGPSQVGSVQMLIAVGGVSGAASVMLLNPHFGVYGCCSFGACISTLSICVSPLFHIMHWSGGVPPLWLACVLCFSLMFGNQLYYNNIVKITMDSTPTRELQTSIQGLFFTTGACGGMIGTVCSNLLYDWAGKPAVDTGSLCCCIVMFLTVAGLGIIDRIRNAHAKDKREHIRKAVLPENKRRRRLVPRKHRRFTRQLLSMR